MPAATAAVAANGGAAATPAARIAIIGAGSSGLAAARVFSRHGVVPVVLEKEEQSGGVWNYSTGSKTRPMYQGLRTNLPKQIMQFREFPFSEGGPSFLTHRQVQDYLLEYQTKFDLKQYIQYGCEVCRVKLLLQEEEKSLVSPANECWPRFQVEWNDTTQSTSTQSEVFDAVCIANGHYSKPAYSNIPGLKTYYKGRVMHSIEYDSPGEFQGQTVLCVGGRASGSDLAREIGAVAKHVYLSDSAFTGTQPETHGNISWVPLTIEIQADGSVRFDGCSAEAVVAVSPDVIIFCTGYDYDFPFLDDNNIIQCTPGERRVMPLYEQLWHAQYPTLSFLGLPHSVVPFPEVEFQAEAVHAQYFVRNQLPVLEERIKAANADAVSGGSKQSGRIKDTHHLGGKQWDYCRKLAQLAGLYDETVDNYLTTSQMIYQHSWENRKGAFPAGPDLYREIDYKRNDDGGGGKPGFTFEQRSG